MPVFSMLSDFSAEHLFKHRWCTYFFAFALLCSAETTVAETSAPQHPIKIEKFCPAGTEIVDGTYQQGITEDMRKKIEKVVLGFIRLDANDGRKFSGEGHGGKYWEMGYTAKFSEEDLPAGSLEYFSLSLANICSGKSSVLAIFIADVAVFSSFELSQEQINAGFFPAERNFWDAFSRQPYEPPSTGGAGYVIPTQPVVLVALPLENLHGSWVVAQRKVPNLLKFKKKEWQRKIDQDSKNARCGPSHTSGFHDSGRCDRVQVARDMLKALSRPRLRVSVRNSKS